MDESFLYDLVLPKWEHENVTNRILDTFSNDVDKTPGNFHFDVASSMALEFERLAVELLVEVMKRSFAQFSYEQYLTMRSQEEGVDRRSGLNAFGEITFVGEVGSLIPANTVLRTPSSEGVESVAFRLVGVTEDLVIPEDGKLSVSIEAIEAGLNGNIPAHSITILEEPIDGISAVYNELPTRGGLDEEDDDSLRERLFEESKRDEGEGNVDDYISWTKEMPGVGNVLVQPLWKGPGTVRVVILDKDGLKPTDLIIDTAQEFLDPGSKGIGEGRAPIGHRVHVQGPDEVKVDVIVPGLIPEQGYTLEQARENATKTLREEFVKASPGSIVRIKDIESSLVLTRGILDIGDILLNGERVNIRLDVDEKAEVGEVAFT